MENFDKLLKKLNQKSQVRLNAFSIEKMEKLSQIEDKAYLEHPIWLESRGKIVCLCIDLTDSAKLSSRKSSENMAKLYDYFTQNAVEILSTEGFRADYLDIKGDGVFGLYEGGKAIERAFVAGIMFKTFFEWYVRENFAVHLHCKMAINTDKTLVKRIGKRARGEKDRDNEVWAGELVNIAYEIMGLSKEIIESGVEQKCNNSIMIVSKEIYDYLYDEQLNYAVYSCGCGADGNKKNLWNKYDCLEEKWETIGNEVYHGCTHWCKDCGDTYINHLLND